MRRLILLAGLFGCASAGAPPGGPPRKDPPQVVGIIPDSNATNVRVRDVDFRFDEVVSDRPAKGELDQMFLISPMDGAPHVSWHRTHIGVRPRHGFRPNTAYTVTLLPGMTDYHGNQSKQSAEVIFSTGPQIPRLAILGRAFDWIAQRPVPGALIQAVHHPDSVVYVTAADSLGGFSLGPIGPGVYTVYGIVDQNGNRARDPGEAWDSLTVAVDSTRPTIELLTIQRDSVGPSLDRVAAADSGRAIRVSFTRPVSPEDTLTPAQFRVQRSDSSVIAVASVQTARLADSIRADSARRADSIRAAANAKPRVTSEPPIPIGPARPAPPAPKPSRPAPSSEFVLRLGGGATVEPSKAYRVSAVDVRNVMGIARSSYRILTVPKPPPPDTTKRAAPRDTTRRPPTDSTRRRPP